VFSEEAGIEERFLPSVEMTEGPIYADAIIGILDPRLETPRQLFLHADLAQESLIFQCFYDAAVEEVIRVGFLGFRVLA
jgi:hypothetical protein